MDYLVFHFKIEPYDEAYSDVLASELCDVGFDSFETISKNRNKCFPFTSIHPIM